MHMIRLAHVVAMVIALASGPVRANDASSMLARTPNGALWWAVFELDPDEVKAALKLGADPNATRPEANVMAFGLSETPLDAVCSGIEHSREHGSEIEPFGHEQGMTYFHHSAFADRAIPFNGGDSDPQFSFYRNRATEIARVLISHGTKWRRSRFECATELGAVGLVKLLLESGVKPTNYGLYTDTQYAKLCGQEEVYRLLVAYGGTPVDAKLAKQLALTEAADWEDINGMAKALDAGAQLNVEDSAGYTALCAAALSLHNDDLAMQFLTVWWLLDQGANPHASYCHDLPDRDPIGKLIQYDQASKIAFAHYLFTETMKRLHR